jgi:diaminohydroxyphosphoribosylaminopyrimidine deaminase / 5-amino-6-(5-phosphoribosylamino)uracil reductase
VLDVRLPGLEQRSPQRLLLTTASAPHGWTAVASPHDAANWPHANTLLVEGGARTAAAFLQAGLVDRLILYRAPILIGAGRACLGDIGLGTLADAHGRWRHIDRRMLGGDQLDVYDIAHKD